MTIGGSKHIENPYITGFEFVAGQLGASEVQIAHFTRRPPRTIMKSNQHIGSMLAFPYHGTRGAGPINLTVVEMWWDQWQKKNTVLKDVQADVTFDLALFRDLIDPWLKHIDSPEDIPPARQLTKHERDFGFAPDAFDK